MPSGKQGYWPFVARLQGKSGGFQPPKRFRGSAADRVSLGNKAIICGYM